VILLDAVVQVLALPNTNGFKAAARPILKAVNGVTGMIASRLVWLPSMMMRSGRPCRANAFLKKRLAAERSRCSLSQNSTVSPLLPSAQACRHRQMTEL